MINQLLYYSVNEHLLIVMIKLIIYCILLQYLHNSEWKLRF